MDLPLGDSNYYQLLEQAVFKDKSDSPAYLTSMTKAYFKDGNVDHALKFFESGIHKRREMSTKQEDMLIQMYDQTFEQETMDIEKFKQKYLSIMIAREKMKKEVKSADLLQGILERCDHQEIQEIFTLQIVLKEEKALLEQVANFTNVDYDLIYSHYDKARNLDTFFKDFGNSNERALNELKTVRERKNVLQ